MTQDEIIEMALEEWRSGDQVKQAGLDRNYTNLFKALAKLVVAKAIAELESQEPVAHCTVRPLRGDEAYPKTEILWVKGRPIAGPLYTHPPQRTWVGLNDEEVRQMCGSVPSMKEAVQEAEAKLKEKNCAG